MHRGLNPQHCDVTLSLWYPSEGKDTKIHTNHVCTFFLHGEGPRSRCYGRTTVLRHFVQPCDEDEQFFLPRFISNGAPVE
jgi:hypothetical protein